MATGRLRRGAKTAKRDTEFPSRDFASDRHDRFDPNSHHNSNAHRNSNCKPHAHSHAHANTNTPSDDHANANRYASTTSFAGRFTGD